MSHGRRGRSIEGWPAAVTLAGVATTFLIAGPVLALAGLNYSTSSGGALEKVHPGTDLILLGAALAAVGERHPLSWLQARIRRFFGTMLLLAVTVFLTVYLIAVLHVPFTPLIDTFAAPAVLLLVLADLTPHWKARLETGLHLFLAVNALLGIAEFLTGWRLVPVALGGIEQTADVEARAFGLLGHPLSSAAMAGLYAVVLMSGGGRGLPAWLRMPALGLQALALGAFGGRTALVMTALFALVSGSVAGLRVFAGRPVDLRVVGLGLILAPLGIAALGAVAMSGFFDVVLNRFVDDNGSASARGAIFALFGYLTWPDLLFGPDPDYLTSLQHLIGIEVGVESFWLAFILAFGLLPSLVFFAGFALFLRDVARLCDPAVWGAILFFCGIISTSLSLSAKSTMLTEAVTLLVVLMPRAAPKRAVRFAPVSVPALP